VSLDGLIQRVELDDDDALHQPGFIDIRGTTANQESAAAGLNRRSRELGIRLERGLI
jgi:hypothetical protein